MERLPVVIPKIKEMRNMATKIQKRIIAIPDAADAMPPNPNTAAMIATTKKIKAYLNIQVSPGSYLEL